jgi:hypothetical protein
MSGQAVQDKDGIFPEIVPAQEMANDLFRYMKMFILEQQPFFENISYKGKIFLPEPFRRVSTFRDTLSS